jgi:predicted enzyme related to lactoylglutathione lyase
MPVTGIGGLFFRARDPEALMLWYRDRLGIGLGDHGMWEQGGGTTVFSPFPADSDYFASDKAFMLNLRVDRLDELLASLGDAGVEVITKPEWEDPSIGRFARIHDPEGNPIELWEPPAS